MLFSTPVGRKWSPGSGFQVVNHESAPIERYLADRRPHGALDGG